MHREILLQPFATLADLPLQSLCIGPQSEIYAIGPDRVSRYDGATRASVPLPPVEFSFVQPLPGDEWLFVDARTRGHEENSWRRTNPAPEDRPPSSRDTPIATLTKLV